VYELLMTQRADGSFPRSSVLTQWLGAARSAALDAACKAHDERLVLTALVIALLTREAPERDSEWRPALNKAKAFCAKLGGDFDAAVLL